jgi:phosphoribosyl-AMP cyclohydrolase
MSLQFDREGLLPAVIQDDLTNEVLMVAFLNEEALRLTRETGYTHFYSRSRRTIWRKGEQSGHLQQVRAILVNCEENSLLIRVVQHGGAACHEGYRSCYYRRLLPDGTYQVVAGRLFDPADVYRTEPLVEEADSASAEEAGPLEEQLAQLLRRLYAAYLYLRDHDLSEESHTSRLLQEHDKPYLLGRLADELQELAGVQSGEHRHQDRQTDTVLEGSQVGYWLLLLAAGQQLGYEEFAPHSALLEGYRTPGGEEQAMEMQQRCLQLLASEQREEIIAGLRQGFALIGQACAAAGVNPLAPAAADLEQMRRKGLLS